MKPADEARIAARLAPLTPHGQALGAGLKYLMSFFLALTGLFHAGTRNGNKSHPEGVDRRRGHSISAYESSAGVGHIKPIR